MRYKAKYISSIGTHIFLIENDVKRKIDYRSSGDFSGGGIYNEFNNKNEYIPEIQLIIDKE